MKNLITKQTSQKAWDKDYKSYPDTHPDGIEAYHESRMYPIFYEIKEKSKVLDVGCNSGEFMLLLKERKECDVTGIDMSTVALKKARERNLKVYEANAEKLPFSDNSFDVVTLMEVLVHTMHPTQMLEEIKRVLKPDGYLLGSAPHQNLERHLWDDKRMHHRYYNEDSIIQELGGVFDKTDLRILKGGQFSMSMANSFLSDQPVEILFKSGKYDMENWESILKDKSILRTMMMPTQLLGDVYYRMLGYADHMSRMGCEIGYESFDPDNENSLSDWQRRLRQKHVQHQLEQALRVADISVWQLTASPFVLAYIRCAKDLIKKPIVTEIDDLMFDLSSFNIASGPYRPNSDAEDIGLKQLQASDAFIVSTTFIKEQLGKMFKKMPIYVLGNSIDFNVWDNVKPWYTLKKKKKRDGIRIGYTGCGNHSGDLEIVKEPLMALIEEYPNLEFILSQPFESWDKIKHKQVIRSDRWVNIFRYPSMVKGWDLDIGIAPLRDNNMNRAKSNLRWLEYSALKVPTIASNVRPFSDSIRNGRDGWLVTDKQEWYDKMKNLIHSKTRRLDMGKRAYGMVKRKHNMVDLAKHYKFILEEIKDESIRSSS